MRGRGSSTVPPGTWTARASFERRTERLTVARPRRARTGTAGAHGALIPPMPRGRTRGVHQAYLEGAPSTWNAEHRARGPGRGRHRHPHRQSGAAEPHAARRVRGPGPPRHRHGPRAGDGRRPEGRQRPPRDGDEHGAHRLPALPEVAAARPQRPALGRPRPLRAVDGPLEPDALRAALPLRLRHGARRPEGAPHLGLADPRPPRGRSHPRRRDDDRPARPGRRQRRRHGDGRPPRARPVRPRRARGREPVRPHHLVLRLRRRPRGGRQRRGVVPGRHAAARQPGARLRRQPDLDRGRHEHRLHRGRRQALRGLRLARPARRRRRGPGRGRRRVRRRQGRDRPPVDHRAARRSSAGPRRTSRTPAPRTARPSATTR